MSQIRQIEQQSFISKLAKEEYSAYINKVVQNKVLEVTSGL